MSDTETDADDTPANAAGGDGTVSYCPFCGAESEYRVLRDVPEVYEAHACTDEECGAQFGVEVPYPRTRLEWGESR